MAVILSIVILGLYLFLISKASKEWLNAFCARGCVFKALYTAALLLPGLFLRNLLSLERFIYYWDLAGYWKKAIFFSDSFYENPTKSLRILYDSINYDEYNLLPNLLLAPVNKLFGLSFENYIFSIHLVYLIPLALIISSLCLKTIQIKNEQVKFVLPLVCLTFTPLIIAMRFGMLDMIGLIVVFAILKILITQDFLTKRNYMTAFGIGLLLTVMLFTRRWYIFWVVAYFPTLFIINVVRSLVQKNTKILWATVINLTVSGVVVAAILLAFFFPYFEMSVLKDYQDIYSAYRKSTFSEQVASFLYFYGALILALSGIGTVILFTHNAESRKLIVFLSVSTAIITVLFLRINNFGTLHHYYLLAPLICVPYIFGAIAAKHQVKKVTVVIFTAVVILNYVSVFISPIVPTSKLFSTSGGYARIRNDFEEVQKLANDLINIQNDGHYVYVLASSHILSDEIIQNAKLPDLHAFPAMLETQHVDKRDRFPNQLFLANYIVVTEPVQLHLLEEDQLLISYLNNQILQGSLAHRYETVARYELDKDIVVHLKKKVDIPSTNEISEIASFFRSRYPDYPSMYEVDENITRLLYTRKGDGAGSVKYESGRVMIIPGHSSPSSISFTLDSSMTHTISFQAGFANKDQIINECDPERDGEVFFSIYQDGHLYNKTHLTHQRDSAFTIDVSGVSKLEFQVDKGSNENWCDWFELGEFKITQH